MLYPELNTSVFDKGFLADLETPDRNFQKNPETLIEHLRVTENRVITRFPPEPNGYLHIGHAKAMLVNFGYARAHQGVCYLRFDDTNPESEKHAYAESIKEIVDWLGFEPYKITYSSDYFEELYELAIKLIKKGLAYVDHSSDEELKIQRGGESHGPRVASKYRDRSVEENLEEFEKMKAGKYQPKEAFLRMKMDLHSGNPQMWDLIAYRVLTTPHYRTGNTWKIYPTYDFTHCLVDSIENITHSLCTTEFVQSRESYNWLCESVDVYCPPQREYGRLNIEGTVLSKRKILTLVQNNVVSGWDDPRLYTLVGLRRRGVPPGAILYFVSQLGVTDSVSTIATHRFEQAVRVFLENCVPRLMMVLDPIRVNIENLPEDYLEYIDVPYHPKVPELGSHKVPFTKAIYIDRSDFREEDSKDFFRLTPNKHVGLFKTNFPIQYISHSIEEETGKVKEIVVRYMNEGTFKKPKAYIQWIAECPKENSPIKVAKVNDFSQLLKDNSTSDEIMSQISKDSLNVIETAIIEVGIRDVKKEGPWPKTPKTYGNEQASSHESTRFQAMRIGYYCLDKDSSDETVILNRIVTLKEDRNK